jgi:hypothetical protein
LGGVAGKVCQALRVPTLLEGCPPSSSTEAPAPPALARRPPPRFLARVSMYAVAEYGHPSVALERVHRRVVGNSSRLARDN